MRTIADYNSVPTSSSSSSRAHVPLQCHRSRRRSSKARVVECLLVDNLHSPRHLFPSHALWHVLLYCFFNSKRENQPPAPGMIYFMLKTAFLSWVTSNWTLIKYWHAEWFLIYERFSEEFVIHNVIPIVDWFWMFKLIQLYYLSTLFVVNERQWVRGKKWVPKLCTLIF